MASSTITSKGQVTIPAEVRRNLGLQAGDRVLFRQVGRQVILESVNDPIDRLSGMLKHLAEGRPTVTIEEMKEAAAAGWAEEPYEPKR